MCGLGGVLDWSASADVGTIRPLIDALTHRGPNGIHTAQLGPLAVGHARLSILDTSAAGDQPMTSVDGRYTTIHNGEIYNFLELAEELRALGHVFHTRSDTEVILAAHAQWGPRCVERFNGIWAFVIWDHREQSLFVSRDRLGVKPLFLAQDGNRLAFASEIKALLTLPWVKATPHAGAVRDFLLDARLDHGRATFFEGITRLAPGHNLVADRNGVREQRYWAPPPLSRDSGEAAGSADTEMIEQVRAAVIDSVALQLRSDVPIGSCLSGGLDSSAIVTIADALRDGRLNSKVQHHERDQAAHLAFFADFPDPHISERRFVDEVVKATGVELRTTRPSSEEALESLEAVVDAQDEPFGSTSIVAQYHVMKLVREAGVPVLLDGQGADELFGGYSPYRSHRDASLLLTRRGPGLVARHLREGAPGRIPRSLWSLVTRGSPPPSRLRSSRRIRPLLGEAVSGSDGVEPAWMPRKGTPLGSALWRDVAWASLPGLLRYEDRNSMAFGIEARVPFLDHRIVELALSLPDRLKVEDGVHKVVLRRAFEGIVPAAVLERRDKIGYATPEDRWLRAWLPALVRLRQGSAAERFGLIKPGGVGSAFEGWRAGRLPRDVLWRVLSVEMWARRSLADEALPLREAA